MCSGCYGEYGDEYSTVSDGKIHESILETRATVDVNGECLTGSGGATGGESIGRLEDMADAPAESVRPELTCTV